MYINCKREKSQISIKLVIIIIMAVHKRCDDLMLNGQLKRHLKSPNPYKRQKVSEQPLNKTKTLNEKRLVKPHRGAKFGILQTLYYLQWNVGQESAGF